MATARSAPVVLFNYKLPSGLNIQICFGDITESQADSIVVPEGITFEHTGFVSRRLIEMEPRYAKIRKKLVQKNGKFKPWEVYTEKLGSNYEHVICAIVPLCGENVEKWKTDLKLLYKRIEREADRKNIAVLGVPLLGSGGGGGGRDDAIEVAIVAAAKFKGTHFKTVMFVSNDEGICEQMARSCGWKDKGGHQRGTPSCPSSNTGHSQTGQQSPRRKLEGKWRTHMPSKCGKQSTNVLREKWSSSTREQEQDFKVVGNICTSPDGKTDRRATKGRNGVKERSNLNSNLELGASEIRQTYISDRSKSENSATQKYVPGGTNKSVSKDGGKSPTWQSNFSLDDHEQDEIGFYFEENGRCLMFDNGMTVERDSVQRKLRHEQVLNVRSANRKGITATFKPLSVAPEHGSFTQIPSGGCSIQERSQNRYKDYETELGLKKRETEKELKRVNEAKRFDDDDQWQTRNSSGDTYRESDLKFNSPWKEDACAKDRSKLGCNDQVKTYMSINENVQGHIDHGTECRYLLSLLEGYNHGLSKANIDSANELKETVPQSLYNSSESAMNEELQMKQNPVSLLSQSNVSESKRSEVNQGIEHRDQARKDENVFKQSTVNIKAHETVLNETYGPKVMRDRQRDRLKEETANGRKYCVQEETNKPCMVSTTHSCPICLEDITDAKQLDKCGHVFCRDCIDDSFKHHKPVCPSCNMVYGILTGNQPDGTMDVGFSGDHLPGYEGHGTITITYYFPSGIQETEHPNPGQQYKGTTRRAYLPDCPEGRVILKLLKTAFDRKLTFTIGRSATTGQENVVTWNDIHHKTNMDGGPTRFGYPDRGYLNRVKEELASKGVTE